MGEIDGASTLKAFGEFPPAVPHQDRYARWGECVTRNLRPLLEPKYVNVGPITASGKYDPDVVNATATQVLDARNKARDDSWKIISRVHDMGMKPELLQKIHSFCPLQAVEVRVSFRPDGHKQTLEWWYGEFMSGERFKLCIDFINDGHTEHLCDFSIKDENFL